MELAEREVIEGDISQLRERIKNINELKKLFEPAIKYVNTDLKDATEDKVILNLRSYVKNNHHRMLTDKEFDSDFYKMEDWYNYMLVNELLHRASLLTANDITELTKEILTNEALLKSPIITRKSKHEIICDEMLKALNANPGKTKDTYYYNIVANVTGTNVTNIRQTIYDWIDCRNDFDHPLREIWKFRASQKRKRSSLKSKPKKK